MDADGANGDDNSFFQPSTNRISFGHGCVDDNEDADVILHEYGHALHYSINEDWFGGDTGAIGEGFSDYWAQSYSISTENGLSFLPNLVFNWDGHGENVNWAGRILNAFDARYTIILETILLMQRCPEALFLTSFGLPHFSNHSSN